jgi:dihydrofolate reductase
MSDSAVVPVLGMIWAQDKRGVIGAAGGIPWEPVDIATHFEDVTAGSPVIMGRRTWDSLPEARRPLPGRLNMVVTRNDEWRENGATPVRSLDDALDQIGNVDAWIIGGGQIFSEAVGRATLAVVTEINHGFRGDVYAPGLGSEWVVDNIEPAAGWTRSSTGFDYRVVTYRKS